MTALKIKDRKNTTSAGIEALDNLFESFDLEHDVANVVGSTFDAKADIGENNTLWAEKAEIRINNGNVEIYAWAEAYGYEPQKIYTPWNIEKIDFAGAFASLKDAIEKYNIASLSKDAEIEKFLTFCADYK